MVSVQFSVSLCGEAVYRDVKFFPSERALDCVDVRLIVTACESVLNGAINREWECASHGLMLCAQHQR